MKIQNRPTKWDNVERMSNYASELDRRIFLQFILLAIAIACLVGYAASLIAGSLESIARIAGIF